MPDDTETDNGPKMIGFEILQNMTDLDRVHAIWHRRTKVRHRPKFESGR
jgi:hypothetical protein